MSSVLANKWTTRNKIVFSARPSLIAEEISGGTVCTPLNKRHFLNVVEAAEEIPSTPGTLSPSELLSRFSDCYNSP
jgi:hypothetical protein